MSRRFRFQRENDRIQKDDSMSEMENGWVLFVLNKQHYGIRAEYIQEMVLFDNVSKLPDHPDYLRGVVNLRGTVIPIVDLRMRLGLTGYTEERNNLIDIFDKQEKEHADWLKELKTSVEGKREFTLTSNPHACEFGEWYDKYRTDNELLKSLLGKLDAPHRAIHNIAIEVAEYVQKDDSQHAMAIIQNAWNTEFTELRSLFNETRQLLRESAREIVIVTKYDDSIIGFVVDKVEDVLDIQTENIAEPPKLKNGKASSFIRGLAKINKEVRILLKIEFLIKGCELASLS